jgi:hypothetical protein
MDYGARVRELAEQYPITNKASAASIFAFVRRVAWELRGEGFGLMEKSYGGENEFEYQGTKYSLSRIATVDRHYKILTDAGPNGDNGPTWVDEGPLPVRTGVSFKPALPPEDGPVPPRVDATDPLFGEYDNIGRIEDAKVGSIALKYLDPFVSRLKALEKTVADLQNRQPDAVSLPKKIALRSLANGKLLCADKELAEGQLIAIYANRDDVGSWETYELIVVE